MQRVKEVIRTIETNDSPERFRDLGVNVVFGEGQFTGKRSFTVGDQAINARKFVIATGSRPAIPSIAGLDQVPYLTNETLFSLQEDVPKLIILGAGPIGCEIAQAFARLGSEVHVIDMATQILPREDPDMAKFVEKSMIIDGVQFYLGQRVLYAERAAKEIVINIVDQEDQETRLQGSHLLIAAGRRANVENMGLEAAGVRLANGRLITDTRLRTTNKNIFACGDVAGPYQFIHMAEHQTGVVLRNALFYIPTKTKTTAIPWCIFTDPELARIGLSEPEAKQQRINHRVYTFPFSEIDRAVAEGERAGIAKIITTPKGKLLGAAISGLHAGELIHEYVLALSKGLNVSDLSTTIHIYPTLAQINRRVADQRLKESLTPLRKKWIRRLFSLNGDLACES